MVHAGDFHLVGVIVLDRVVGAVMAVVHLDGLGPQCQRKHLMPKANPENRQVGRVQDVLDHRHGINARRRRIAGAVGQENTVGVQCQHVLGGGCRGQHRHIAPRAGKTAQNVAFRAVINGDDLVFGGVLGLVAFGPGPAHFVPVVGLGAGHVLGQIKPFKPCKTTRGLDQIAR